MAPQVAAIHVKISTFHQLREVSTAEGPDGDWSNWTLCDEGEPLDAGRWEMGAIEPGSHDHPQVRASTASALKVTVLGRFLWNRNLGETWGQMATLLRL